MSDLNQFQRSKDRLTEILCELAAKNAADPHTVSYKQMIETSINQLDKRMEEFKLKCKPAKVVNADDLIN